jgi:molybdopterin molybdotransferase
MISYTQALGILHSKASLMGVERVTLMQSLGRVTAETVYASRKVPGFDNSAMDGFAIVSEWTREASSEKPLRLAIDGTLAAGELPRNINERRAVEIMTGAILPRGADAVIPLENVTIEQDEEGRRTATQISEPVRLHQNVRFAGEDFEIGTPLVKSGRIVTPGAVAVLAASGIAEIMVRKRPCIGQISSGKEVVDDLTASLEASQIYNSNAPYLQAVASLTPSTIQKLGHIGDDPEALSAILYGAPPGSILISSGAVSKGRHDFIPEVLKSVGATIHFHGVAIKPGKPILFATFDDGRVFFGLPGNPISTAVGWNFFVRPFLTASLGLKAPAPIKARLSDRVVKKGPLRHFLKGRLGVSPEGVLTATVLPGQESFKILPLVPMNCWVILKEESSEFSAGDLVEVIPTGDISA